MNRAILIGRVGKDPEIRHTQDGKPIANFSLATSERWRDKNGEKQERTEWHNIVIFAEGLAKVVEKFVHKGDQLMIEGKIQTRKWTDKEGRDRWSTEVVVQGMGGTMEMLGSPSGSNGHQRASDSDDRGSSKKAEEPEAPDDEIPF